jgi:Zn-dependent protease with chaperone function/Zn-finger nucleic acid-binding protein
MNCPACRTELRELPTPEGVTIDFCSGCRGSWFERGELLYVARRPTALGPMLERPLVSAADSPLACPRCTTPMERGGVGSMQAVIDRCRRCGGIWLASGMRTRLDQVSAPAGVPAASVVAAAARARRPGAAPLPEGEASLSARGEPLTGPGASMTAPTAAPRGAGRTTMLKPGTLPKLPDLGLRSVLVLAGMYGMAFVAMVLAVSYVRLGLDVALLLAAVAILAQYCLSPMLLDLFLRWMQSMEWVSREELPPHLVEFLDRLCRARKIPFPRVGIIDDGNPNAFTYGHYPTNARLVLTAGLLEILDEEELEAVVAHEVGHIAHWDFVVMTVAALVPVLLFWLYRALAGGADRKGRAPVQVLVAVYLMYVLAEHLILFLSRAREYYADRFAGASTRKPDALARALVKIAYGLAAATPEEAEAKATSGLGAVAALGIFDPRTALSLAAASARPTGGVAPQDIVGAMQWDLWNPWAGFYELASTHPLPAKRILALGRLAERFGEPPSIRFDTRQPESYWDEFWFDVFVAALPLALPVAALGLMLPAMALWGGLGPLWALHTLGIALVGFGVGALIRTVWSYRAGAFPPSTVAALLQHVTVSGVRSVPVQLRGRIIGRGIPGLVYSEDLVLRDDTGFIFLDYRQPFRLMELWFGLARAGDLVGADVTVTGWYRRAPTPFLELRTVEIGGEVRSCWVRTAKLFVGALAVVIGMLLALA